MPATTWTWPDAVVTRVIDGDTIEAKLTRIIDLGFRQTQATTFPVKLRLNRINAPKLNSPAGHVSRDAVVALLVEPVFIETLLTYKYGGRDTPEWMAEVTLPDGTNLSDVLVQRGLAVLWDGQGPRPADV